MENLILRKATSADMNDILQLQYEVFKGEQKIPREHIPLPVESSPQWWCALVNGIIVGAAASWEDNNQVHWGRFATSQSYRGLHIGTRLAQFSLNDLFSQPIAAIYSDARDATVNILCKMGGKVIGEPVTFYEDVVTPVVLYKEDFYQFQKKQSS